MIRDANLNFDTAAALTVTADSTNVIDLGVARDLSATDHLSISSLVTTTFTGGTSLQVTVVGSPDNSTWTVLASGEVVPLASLVQGAQIYNMRGIPSVDPVDGAPYRYLKLNYVIVGTMTAGAVTSDIVMGKENARGYPGTIAYTAPANQTFVAG